MDRVPCWILLVFLAIESTCHCVLAVSLCTSVPANYTPPFFLPSADAEALRNSWGCPTPEDLTVALVPFARALHGHPHSRFAPISDYPVGMVGLGKGGDVLIGVNLEFPGLPLSETVHAEQMVASGAVLSSQLSLNSLAGTDVPCGHCRQFLQELTGAQAIQFLIRDGDGGVSLNLTLAELLPHPFSLNDSCKILSRNPGCPSPWFISSPPSNLQAAAIEAACHSHSPYTNSMEGVALEADDGRIFAGARLESCAYNPTLRPMQMALVAMLHGGGAPPEGPPFASITRAVLAVRSREAMSPDVAQSTGDVLRVVAPQAEYMDVLPFENCP